MTSEEEERPRFVTGGYGRHRCQWVNKLRQSSIRKEHVSLSILLGYQLIKRERKKEKRCSEESLQSFDTVDHNLLLHKLKSVGLSDDTLNWFQSYLTNRKQKTSVGDALFVAAPITVGVPQGSILGLNFLSIFVHISGSIRPITLIWAPLERSFPAAEVEYR